MADMMMFPDTWEEFEEYYGITDREQIYTNGARLIPSFRVKQWLDHIADRKTEPQTDCRDCGYAWWNSDAKRYECMMKKCRYEDEPQTDCSWQKGE